MSRVKAGSVTRSRHKKILKRAKVISVEEKTLLKSQIKLSRKLVSTHIETGKLKRENLGDSGFKELMQDADYMVSSILHS